MAGPLVLYYNLDARTEARLKSLCQKQHLRCRGVLPQERALPIGALAGIPVSIPPADEPPLPFGEPMLVMCNMLNTHLSLFLQGMRESGLPRIPLKAVLTPSNVTWNSRQLRDELTREHEAVQRGAKPEG